MKRKKKVNGFMRYIETDIINLTDDLKKDIDRTIDTYRLMFNKSLEYIMDNFDCYIDDKEKCLYFKSKPKFINAVELYKNIFKYLDDNYKNLILMSASLMQSLVVESVITKMQTIVKGHSKKIKFKLKKEFDWFKFCRKGPRSLKVKQVDKKWFVLIQKVGWVEVVYRKVFRLLDYYRDESNDIIRQIVVKKKGSTYKLYLVCELPEDYIKDNSITSTNKSIAFDWGIRDYFTTWDGEKSEVFNLDFKHVKYLDNKISNISHKMDKCVLNSKKYLKLKDRLIKTYIKKKNYISYHLNIYAKELVSKYDRFIFENTLSNTKKYNKLNIDIKNRPFYQFKMILKYLCEVYNKEVLVIPKYYPSTQECSSCGYVKSGKDKVGDSKVYKCSKCGHEDGRDVNAAKNIYNCKDKVKF